MCGECVYLCVNVCERVSGEHLCPQAGARAWRPCMSVVRELGTHAPAEPVLCAPQQDCAAHQLPQPSGAPRNGPEPLWEGVECRPCQLCLVLQRVGSPFRHTAELLRVGSAPARRPHGSGPTQRVPHPHEQDQCGLSGYPNWLGWTPSPAGPLTAWLQLRRKEAVPRSQAPARCWGLTVTSRHTPRAQALGVRSWAAPRLCP